MQNWRRTDDDVGEEALDWLVSLGRFRLYFSCSFIVHFLTWIGWMDKNVRSCIPIFYLFIGSTLNFARPCWLHTLCCILLTPTPFVLDVFPFFFFLHL